MSTIICVTPRLLTEDGIEKQFVNTRYIDQLTKRGFNALQLTLDNPNPTEIFEFCDGFLITGGADINPIRFGEVNQGLSRDINNRLDRLDSAVVDYAVNSNKPLLGICRGLQSLNVFLGGSLYQDLGPLNDTHKRISSNHKVNMKPHPYFNWDKQLLVNSYHHQAIKELAPDLKVIGTHEDGTIEMVVHKTLPMFAVQWHPEINSDSESSKIIFNTFLKLVQENNVSKDNNK